jgi:hypothetical protein
VKQFDRIRKVLALSPWSSKKELFKAKHIDFFYKEPKKLKIKIDSLKL